MTNITKMAIAGAVVAAVVPAFALTRKRVKASKVRKTLASARAKARKVAHAPKPRKARRVARHLAKSVGA